MGETMELSIMEKVVVQGNLAALKSQERLEYYSKICESLGLNPLTRPFEYLSLDGKLVLYAKRDATDQLRKIHSISIAITNRERIGDVYCVTAKATTSDGRCDESVGAVPLIKEEKIFDELRQRKVPTGRMLPLTPDEFAVAVMKCETKAKRRVTLSIAGLGMMDESEMDVIDVTPEAEPMGNSPLPTGNASSGKQQSSQGQKQHQRQSNAEEPKQPQQQGAPNNNQRQQQGSSNAALQGYRLLDFATGTSPGGVTFAKIKVQNLANGKEEVVIARSPEALEQVNAIENDSVFNLTVEIENGFKIVKAVQFFGDAA
ncbi:hypothetical protein KIH86_03905 [Paenibacillus sp. HN-1]|uniref:hypothetical protein n=1 Tax=Paenibacillus TaxID=44249 RepID=UPI001CA8D540|nr:MULTISPECIES: hypothetical protein [Paenibacillus]MBY9079552.1 hypothetical protein [Paenibacillus sp. CGMCC 1.18879]MBY9083373.1 hypothetical protein [Paenibacillus sinensis]